jgi:hypothetical protein
MAALSWDGLHRRRVTLEQSGALSRRELHLVLLVLHTYRRHSRMTAEGVGPILPGSFCMRIVTIPLLRILIRLPSGPAACGIRYIYVLVLTRLTWHRVPEVVRGYNTHLSKRRNIVHPGELI